MFNGLLTACGLSRTIPKAIDPAIQLFESIKPRVLTGEVIMEGDPNHSHEFTPVEWDRGRFESDVVDLDKDHGTAVEFPMATFKQLHRCFCGRETITSTRALI